MFKKAFFVIAFFVIFLHSIALKADTFKYVEIFDPKQDKVVKVVQTNQQIQAMITDWITNIDGLYKTTLQLMMGMWLKFP